MPSLTFVAPADRRRLPGHLEDADDLDRLMREPGGLPAAPEPAPLHRASRGITTLANESTL